MKRAPLAVTTLGDMVVARAQSRPDDVAVSFTDESATAQELLDGALHMAYGLHALGVRPHEKVAIVMPNCMDYLRALFGAALLGAVVVTVNARYRGSELAYVVKDSGVKVLLTSDVLPEVDFVALLDSALPEVATAENPLALDLEAAPELRACVMLGSSSPPGFVDRRQFDELAATVPAEVIERTAEAVRLRDPAIMMYTSGTTAMPKGCPLSHEAVIRVGDAINARYGLTEEDAWWDPLPMFHLSSILPLTASLRAGGRYVTMIDFEANAAVEQILTERPSFLFGTFPTLNQELLAHEGFRSADLSFVKYVNQVAPPDLQRALQAAIGSATQVAAYGCTEVGGIISMNAASESGEQRATTCGVAWPGIEVRIVDPDTWADLPTGERGEIVVRGFGQFESYHNDPERNAEAIEPDGWFHTGDIGSVDDEGRITYHGRTKDMLKVGGENVAALEVESYLCTHPSVRLAQVVGIPDERLTEIPAAFVEVEPGHEVTEDELIAFCRGEMASFKVPRHIRVVETWPMGATKIQKFKLRDELLAELDQQQP